MRAETLGPAASWVCPGPLSSLDWSQPQQPICPVYSAAHALYPGLLPTLCSTWYMGQRPKPSAPEASVRTLNSSSLSGSTLGSQGRRLGLMGLGKGGRRMHGGLCCLGRWQQASVCPLSLPALILCVFASWSPVRRGQAAGDSCSGVSAALQLGV